jgi:hypothetical protein
MEVPLIFSFWFMVAAYVIHVLDESLLGGSFVEMVQQHWWPEYSWRKFFWFNTGYFALMITSVVLYDLLGGNGSFFRLRGPQRGYAMVFGMSGGPCISESIRRGC